jgi:hypothetical protein
MELDFDVETLNQFLELAEVLGLRESSYQHLQEENQEIVEAAGVDNPENAVNKLRGYRLMPAENIRLGEYVCWIRSAKASPSGYASGPTAGGTVTKITEQPGGEHTVQCRGVASGRFYQATTRPGLWLFRKLTEQELVVLNVLDAIDHTSTAAQ